MAGEADAMIGRRRTRNTFRLHLALTCGIATATFAVLVSASLFIPLAMYLDQDLGEEIAGGLAAHFLFLHETFWPVAAGSLLASVVTGMLLYQRMTGPLTRFVRIFEQVSEGDVPAPIVIRRVDYLTAEADALNLMLEGLAALSVDRKAVVARCQELLDDLDSGGLDLGTREAGIVADLREALKSLR